MSERTARHGPRATTRVPGADVPVAAKNGAASAGGPRRTGPALRRPQPAYRRVADELRTLIVAGELAPGDRLYPEGDLGASFGVSRSTVREALRVLMSEGLIQTVRGTTGGTFVTRVEPARVSSYLETSIGLMSGTEDITLPDLLEARDLIEPAAASLAAQRREEHHLAALELAIEREKAGHGRTVKFTEHRQFHGLIIEATGNGLLRIMSEPIFRVLQTRFLSPIEADSFWSLVDRDHEEVVARIRAGDAAGAFAAMAAHLDNIRTAYHD